MNNKWQGQLTAKDIQRLTLANVSGETSSSGTHSLVVFLPGIFETTKKFRSVSAATQKGDIFIFLSESMRTSLN